MAKLTILGAAMNLVQTQDPWYNKPYYLRRPVPWDKRRGGVSALSEAQYKVIDAFSEIQKDANAKGLNRWQRRELTARVMRGAGKFGGSPRPARRPPAPKETVESAIRAAESIIARYT